ncbi:importin subunit alpha-2 [Pelomyxa schiedti]|nr:importin subunit alpha-2 [Pelomyxa schiedti]
MGVTTGCGASEHNGGGGGASTGKHTGMELDHGPHVSFLPSGGAPMLMKSEGTTADQRAASAIAMLSSPSLPQQKCGMDTLCRMMSDTFEPPIDKVTQPATMQRILSYLTGTDADLQLYATWCITNIAAIGSHEQTQSIMLAAPYLIAFLSCPNAALQEQASWALGNIAGDSITFRNTIRANGAILPLVSLLKSKVPSVVHTAAFALSNLAKGPVPKIGDFFSAGIAPLLVSCFSSSDSSVLIEIAWLSTYMVASEETYANQLLEAGFFPVLVNTFVNAALDELIIPCLRILGNYICQQTNGDDFTKALVSDPRMIDTFKRLITSTNTNTVLKECAWVISNVAGGLEEYSDTLIREGFLPPMVEVLATANFDARKEMSYAIANLCREKHVELVVAAGAISPMCELLESSAHDNEVPDVIMFFLDQVMHFHPQGTTLVEEAGGISALETLHFHKNPELHRKASALIDKYFTEEEPENPFEDDEDTSTPYPAWRLTEKS